MQGKKIFQWESYIHNLIKGKLFSIVEYLLIFIFKDTFNFFKTHCCCLYYQHRWYLHHLPSKCLYWYIWSIKYINKHNVSVLIFILIQLQYKVEQLTWVTFKSAQEKFMHCPDVMKNDWQSSTNCFVLQGSYFLRDVWLPKTLGSSSGPKK